MNRSETNERSGPEIHSVHPTIGSGRLGRNLGFLACYRIRRRICGNDIEPYAKELVFFSETELFGGSNGSCRRFRRVSPWNIQVTFIPSSDFFLPPHVCAARCALPRPPYCSGELRARFVFRESSPFATR